MTKHDKAIRTNQSRFNQQLGVGVLLDLADIDNLLDRDIEIDWVEIVSEHMMPLEPGGDLRLPLRFDEVLERWPVALHGLELNIGGIDELDWGYLEDLKRLIDRVEPACVSDHMVWTRADGIYSHELLPLPHTAETVEHVVERICRVQNFLGRQLLFENPPSYVRYQHSEMSPGTFFAEIADAADCGLLVDICNLRVDAVNNGTDPWEFITSLPAHRIGQFHVVGYETNDDFAVDSHSRPTPDDVHDLLRRATRLLGPVTALIEWDYNVPSLERLCHEASITRNVIAETITSRVAASAHPRAHQTGCHH